MAIYANGKYLKNQPTAVNPKRKPKKKKFKIRLSPLMKKVIAYVLVVATLISVPMLIQHKRDKEKYEVQIAELVAQHEQEIEDLIASHEMEVAYIHQTYEYGGDVNTIEKEAEYIAKVIYGMARNHSETDQRAVVWCILNRYESAGYPNTIKEVCEQPKQWIEYNEDNPVLDTHYNLALEILKEWHNGGHRPMDKEFVFLSWSSREIILRDTFTEGKNTRYYRFY
jgi:spore germination cell wall hydrolase CwlJ-like protein